MANVTATIIESVLGYPATPSTIPRRPMSLDSYLHIYTYLAPFLLCFYFTFTGLLYLWFFKLADQTKMHKIQPHYGRAKDRTWSNLWEECKWNIPSILIGSSFISFVIEAHFSGNALFFFKYDDYGVAYYAVSVLTMILFNDAWMYFWHRVMHTPKLKLMWIHRIHHRWSAPTPMVTMAFHPLEAVMQFCIITLTMVVPLHLPSLFVFGAILFTISVMEHCGYSFEVYEKLDKIIATPIHHDVHHSRPKVNFGVYLSVWDYLLGTSAEQNPSAKNE